MALDYDTYAQADQSFSWDEKWDIFDGDKNSFNITHECIDRHPPTDTALRIKFSSGETIEETFRTIQTQSAQLAHALEDFDIGRQDPVGTLLEPEFAYYLSIFGILKRGAIGVPMYSTFGPDDIKHAVQDKNIELLITKDEYLTQVPKIDGLTAITVEELPEILEGNPTSYSHDTLSSDISFYQYTGGTTGKPKSVQMRHKTLANMAVSSKFGIGMDPDDRHFCPAPPMWAQGLWYGTMGPLAFGLGAGAYSGRFEPNRFLEALEEFKITNIFSPATALRQILSETSIEDYNLSVRRITSGGEFLDEATRNALTAKLDAKVGIMYGNTEFGTITMDHLGFEDWEVKSQSIGKPLPGLDVAVLDGDDQRLSPGETGEIAVMHKGEWLRTGDAGVVDEEGYFFHKGRIDDIIITAGHRIGPNEVEQALLKHPEVNEAAVVASPDEQRGNVVKAFLNTDSTPSEALKQDIQDFVRERISDHKYPRSIEFIDEFPRAESGKIKRKTLREREKTV